MRLNVSAWSIRKPIPSIVMFAVLFLLGVVSFRTMSITRFPNIDIPIMQVLITQSGAPHRSWSRRSPRRSRTRSPA